MDKTIIELIGDMLMSLCWTIPLTLFLGSRFDLELYVFFGIGALGFLITKKLAE